MDESRILIIEKNQLLAEFMAKELSDLGPVAVCTKKDGSPMPPKDEVLRAIGKTEIVLLDPYADPSYDTASLALFCVDSEKKVVFIPELYDKDLSIFGQIKFWVAKGAFRYEHNIKAYVLSLRNLVLRTLALQPVIVHRQNLRTFQLQFK